MKKNLSFLVVLLTMLNSYAKQSSGVGGNKESTYTVGNFIVRIIMANGAQPQIKAAHESEPQRVLWETVPGVALIGAAIGKDSIIMQGLPEGSFDVRDRILNEFSSQTISRIKKEGGQLVIGGQLSGNGSGIKYR